MTTKHISIRIDPGLHSWLIAAAAGERRSVNAFIEWRLEQERATGKPPAPEQPYTVTIRAIDTGRREVDSRHATLGAAVEAMRDVEDLEGMPSYQPRVEHDGRPVDTETASY
jgi:hypothetical protein